ncbi:hypothetical protein SLI_6270 [Streptomyces lividans 1326]|uniref:Uncharacterized protein n=1 Tax=Streptomyces lividans 1326 TaxID=1200984 RepID=A0A7U9DZS5_STRLI|nr:hypothetical protein SLI_6270 [Streptomyces lividans 1326]
MAHLHVGRPSRRRDRRMDRPCARPDAIAKTRAASVTTPGQAGDSSTTAGADSPPKG